MICVKDISDYINSFAPYATKCDWDNCGILIGKPDDEVKKIGFCLDLTSETLKEAINQGVNLMITHHPVIFKEKKNFLDDDLTFKAAVNHINIISAHTCFDCADGGVNDVLCELLELYDTEKIESEECVLPMARIGSLKEEISSLDFASFVSKKLNTTVRFVDCGNQIRKAAVCGGAGMSFLDEVINSGADAYVTGDISHHEMLEAKEKGITVVAAGHYETEYPAMNQLKKRISEKFDNIDCVLLTQTNPVTFIN
ncbi:MAG: Nif3-like dinuclear metal center hexameric protein [Acutalibacteraceae bacterium]